MLFMTILVFRIYWPVIIFALSFPTALHLRSGVRVARLPNLTTLPCYYTMWRIIVPWIAPKFWCNANTSSLELWTDWNKHQLDPSTVYVGMDITQTLTRGNPSVAFHAAINSLTVNAKNMKFRKKLIMGSQMYRQRQHLGKPFRI